MTNPDATEPDKGITFYRPEVYAPDESVGYLMRRILNLLSQQIDQHLESSGLTNAQWLPLLKLYTGKASTAAELARESMMDAGAMTRLIDRLEAKQLCQRVRSTDDRRIVRIELTDAGRAAARVIPGVLCDVQNAHLHGLTQGEWQTLKLLLQRVLGNALALQGIEGDPK